VVSATQDFFYTSADNAVGGGDDDVSGGFMISGLNPALSYDLKFFASRSATDTRRTLYEVYGASSNSVILQTTGTGIGVERGNGNDKNLAVLSSVRPNAYGEIFVDMSALVEPGSSIFGYLNAMEIRAVSPYESWARSRGLTPGVNSALVSSNLETFALDGSSMEQAGLQGKVRGLPATGSGGRSLSFNFPVRKGTVFSGSTSLSATQDVATDAFAVEALEGRSLGFGNALQVGGYRVGMIVGGGAMLALFATAGWGASFGAMATDCGASPTSTTRKPKATPDAAMDAMYALPVRTFSGS
jgi:hypothetical protein